VRDRPWTRAFFYGLVLSPLFNVCADDRDETSFVLGVVGSVGRCPASWQGRGALGVMAKVFKVQAVNAFRSKVRELHMLATSLAAITAGSSTFGGRRGRSSLRGASREGRRGRSGRGGCACWIRSRAISLNRVLCGGLGF